MRTGDAREYKQRIHTMPKFTKMDAKATIFRLVTQ